MDGTFYFGDIMPVTHLLETAYTQIHHLDSTVLETALERAFKHRDQHRDLYAACQAIHRELDERLHTLTEDEEQEMEKRLLSSLDPFAPRLYTLMRNDLESLNPGKAVAQGQHAANQMVKFCPEDKASMLRWWESQAMGFGTAIVLEAPIGTIKACVDLAKEAGLHAGMTHDPEYPLRDGEVCHLLPLDTCGFVFCYPHQVRMAIHEDIPLMA